MLLAARAAVAVDADAATPAADAVPYNKGARGTLRNDAGGAEGLQGTGVVDLQLPTVLLSSIAFPLGLQLAPEFVFNATDASGGVGSNGGAADSMLQSRPWPDVVCVDIAAVRGGQRQDLHRANVTLRDQGRLSLLHTLHSIPAPDFSAGELQVAVRLTPCPAQVGSGESNAVAHATAPFRAIPGWLSLLPPVLCVIVAVWLKQVFLALLVGIWLASMLMHGYNPLVALLRSFDFYFTRAMDYRSGHAQIVVFCILLAGLLGIVQRSGGAHGLGQALVRFATSKARGSAAALALSFLVFFDDYSSILIVGTTFRKIVPRLGLSKVRRRLRPRDATDLAAAQAKLAFMVHGIGTCMPSMVPISSWLGVEVGYIRGQPELAHRDAFAWLMSSLPHRLFPLLYVATIVLLVLLQRDFGPMAREEEAAMAQWLRQRRRRRLLDEECGA